MVYFCADLKTFVINNIFIIFKNYLFCFYLILIQTISEMTKVQQSGRVPHRDLKYVDIYREKQIRVTVKVLVPVKEHPKVCVFFLFFYYPNVSD